MFEVRMTDDDVDYDLLEFMRAHMNGAGGIRSSESTLGVLESAEQIYDVAYHLRPFVTDTQASLDVSISRDGCLAAAERVLRDVFVG
jgi:hypothetical protein